MAERIELKQVSYQYRTGQRDVLAVDDVSFSVEPSAFLCVLGPSGCGKTTIMNMIAGFLAPTRGEIRIGGAPITGSAPFAHALVLSDTDASGSTRLEPAVVTSPATVVALQSTGAADASPVIGAALQDGGTLAVQTASLDTLPSMPVVPGMCTSRKQMAGCCASNISTASRPLRACATTSTTTW